MAWRKSELLQATPLRCVQSKAHMIGPTCNESLKSGHASMWCRTTDGPRHWPSTSMTSSLALASPGGGAPDSPCAAPSALLLQILSELSYGARCPAPPRLVLQCLQLGVAGLQICRHLLTEIGQLLLGWLSALFLVSTLSFRLASSQRWPQRLAPSYRHLSCPAWRIRR